MFAIPSILATAKPITAALVDPDAIKKDIPEYEQKVAALEALLSPRINGIGLRTQVLRGLGLIRHLDLLRQ